MLCDKCNREVFYLRISRILDNKRLVIVLQSVIKHFTITNVQCTNVLTVTQARLERLLLLLLPLL